MNNRNDLEILQISSADVEALTAVMTRAFDDDVLRHLGQDKGGPPGYDTGEFIRKWGLHKYASGFKAVKDSKIVGCIIVFTGRDGHHRVGNIFTDPEYQKQGIGKALFSFVEEKYPGKSWSLETPAFSLSNHSFYEKSCGFVKIGEGDSGDGAGVEFRYRKTYTLFE